ncbi:MAG: beta-ketoacyl-[acyl-carrier-protein] synthase family protein [Spirochaetes bacterium]|nr:beta-ketoacyl-[acyl-carrier-protein] synthase family protein [Spirochaetota bacterium]
MKNKRIVITGMGVVSPLGDNLNDFYHNLINGKSGIKKLRTIDTSKIDSKIGGDLGDYDYKSRIESFKDLIPDTVFKKAKKILKAAPFSTRLSLLTAIDAVLDSGLFFSQFDRNRVSSIIGGHNFHNQYIENNVIQFLSEPDYIDSLMGIRMFDTDIAASIAESLQIYGPMYTVGGACASAGLALRSTINEILLDNSDIGIVGGGVLEFSRVGSHALAMMNAISYQHFNDKPEKASRPFDTKREGFVPAHGSGMLVVEDLEHALKRGAKIYAEILDVESNNDGNHFSVPSKEGQIKVIEKVFNKAKLDREAVNYVNAHATSTPLGDEIEIASIKEVFGSHAHNLKINATKSMTGHTGWSAHTIELIASILQMKHSKVHPSINIDELDPAIELDVCRNEESDLEIDYFINNSFGFGGINCCTLIKKLRA